MSFVKIAGVRTKISDLPPDIAATVRTALGPTRDPKADPGSIPVVWPEPWQGEDILFLAITRQWWHRCALCPDDWVELSAPVQHNANCPYREHF
jgi:hypothetical protein